MAFPIVQGSSVGVFGSNSTSHPLVVPSSIGSGDLLLAFFGVDGAPTISGWPAGWTQLLSANAAGNTAKVEIRYKVATGSETNFTLTTSASEQSAYGILRIEGHNSSTNAPQIAGGANNTSATPDPDNLVPTGGAKDYLWLEGFVADGENDTTTYFSTNFAGTFQRESSATAAQACLLAVGQWQFNAATMNPDPMAMSASEQWRAFTIAIHPGVEGNSGTNRTITAVPAGSIGATGLTPSLRMNAGAASIGHGNTATPRLLVPHTHAQGLGATGVHVVSHITTGVHLLPTAAASVTSTTVPTAKVTVTGQAQSVGQSLTNQVLIQNATTKEIAAVPAVALSSAVSMPASVLVAPTSAAAVGTTGTHTVLAGNPVAITATPAAATTLAGGLGSAIPGSPYCYPDIAVPDDTQVLSSPHIPFVTVVATPAASVGSFVAATPTFTLTYSLEALAFNLVSGESSADAVAVTVTASAATAAAAAGTHTVFKPGTDALVQPPAAVGVGTANTVPFGIHLVVKTGGDLVLIPKDEQELVLTPR